VGRLREETGPAGADAGAVIHGNSCMANNNSAEPCQKNPPLRTFLSCSGL
jgi:hypothetical protein